MKGFYHSKSVPALGSFALMLLNPFPNFPTGRSLIPCLCLLIGLTGCVQSTEASSEATSEAHSVALKAALKNQPQAKREYLNSAANRFGQFNLHKRHGLGGWQGNAPSVTQRQWLQQLQPAASPNPAIEHAPPR